MKTILVVEDDEQLREMLVEIFISNHFRVLEARDGIEAVSISRSHTVDLILTDIDMPRKNGLQFVKEFRTFDRTTPVVVMSGGLGITSEVQKELGIVLFLPKPFSDLDKIIQALAA